MAETQHVSKHMKKTAEKDDAAADEADRTQVAAGGRAAEEAAPSAAAPGTTAPHAPVTQPMNQAVGYKPISPYVPTQVELPDRRPKRHHPVRNIFILLLICVLVLAGFAAESMMRISKTVGSAEACATQLETAASQGDLAGTRSALSSLTSDMDELSSETNEWIWSVVEKVPYIGTDVTSAKTMVSAMEKVNTEALQPVLAEYDKATAADATADERLAAATDLAASLQNAQAIIEEGKSEISSAPASHIDALKDLQTKLESSLSAVDTNLQTLNSTVSAATDAASLLESALSAAGLS
ncbi:MAG: hypothetical protein ACI361_03665 [Atopobiaceae bacterium]